MIDISLSCVKDPNFWCVNRKNCSPLLYFWDAWPFLNPQKACASDLPKNVWTNIQRRKKRVNNCLVIPESEPGGLCNPERSTEIEAFGCESSGLSFSASFSWESRGFRGWEEKWVFDERGRSRGKARRTPLESRGERDLRSISELWAERERNCDADERERENAKTATAKIAEDRVIFTKPPSLFAKLSEVIWVMELDIL